MKHLKIVYGEAVLWDAPVGSLEWSDSENGVKIEGRVKAEGWAKSAKPARPASGGPSLGGGILDMLAKASKAKASQMEGKQEADEEEGVAKRNTQIVETVEPELEDSA